MTKLYRTQATAIGGRTGSAASADGRLRVRLDLPRSLGGQDGEGTNPEQLFAAGFAACFLSSIRRVAKDEGLDIAADGNVTTNVEIEEGNLRVVLLVDLPGLDAETAQRVVAAADARCVYSRAVRGNVPVDIRLI
ncbi:Ohr family peroxiredoxin [Sphingomonas quercus]|uniref:Ohr family peroxiredoxin n=1 Tax=Sphingomonas quercus TaxID=2842451 RepID=A0ABS6BHK5_9SPHN|nr:Ohr family peroxiredoxin [Sphingomonas quercus]MBU3077789.1 Ohr family peroxiredoxin [Sphingomonas quercus]